MPPRNNNQSGFEGLFAIINALQSNTEPAWLQYPSANSTPNVRANRNARPPANHIRRIIRRTFEQNPIRIRERIAQENSNAILFDGLDDALIGISNRNSLAIYERNLIIDILMTRDSMTYEQAEEFFDFNIAALENGGNTPIIVDLGWAGAESSVTDVSIGTVMGMENADRPVRQTSTRRPRKKKTETAKTEEKKVEVPQSADDPIHSLEL